MRDDATDLGLANRSVEYWFRRYSDRARKAMAIANSDAKHVGQVSITPANVLFGIITQPDSVACHVLTACGIELDTVLSQLNRRQEIPQELDSVRLPADKDTHVLVSESIRVCLANRHNGVGTEHLLVSISRSQCPKMQLIFRELGVSDSDLNETAIQLLAGKRDIPDSWIGKLWFAATEWRRRRASIQLNGNNKSSL